MSSGTKGNIVKLEVNPNKTVVTKSKGKAATRHISQDTSESESNPSDLSQIKEHKTVATITSESRRVYRALEAINDEYQDSINKLNILYDKNSVSNAEKVLLAQRIKNVDKNMEKVTMALEESQILNSFGNYILYQQCDNRKIKMLNSRLEAENDWLREELEGYEERQKQINHDLNVYRKDKEVRQVRYYLQASGVYDDPIKRQRAQSMTVEDVSTLEFPVPLHLHHISTLVETFISSNNYEAGHPLCVYHLNRIKATVGKSHIDYATMLCLSGKLCMMAKRMKEAIKCFHEALPIIHRNNHPASVSSLYNHISQCYYLNGQTVEAEKTALKTLALIERRHGPESDEFFMQVCVLGFLVAQNGKFDDADKYFLLALKNLSSKPKFEDSLKIRLYHAVVNLCAGRILVAEAKVKEIIDEIHEADHGRVSELNPSFWMLLENPRYQRVDKLRQNVRDIQHSDYIIAITVLKYVYKKKGEHKMEAVIDEFLSNPDLEATALDATAESRYFKALTQSTEIINVLTLYIDGYMSSRRHHGESMSSTKSSKSSRSGKRSEDNKRSRKKKGGEKSEHKGSKSHKSRHRDKHNAGEKDDTSEGKTKTH